MPSCGDPPTTYTERRSSQPSRDYGFDATDQTLKKNRKEFCYIKTISNHKTKFRKYKSTPLSLFLKIRFWLKAQETAHTIINVHMSKTTLH
jgi:hypothetical protein